MVLRRRMLRSVVMCLFLASLAGCGSSTEDAAEPGDAGGTPDGAGIGAYRVPDGNCLPGWTGLLVTTEIEAEVDYLDDMPACSNAAGDATYLENRSDAVWLLRSTSTKSGRTTPVEFTLREQSFIDSVRRAYPGQVILVPGARLIIDLSPMDVEWVVDLPLSFAWQAHDVLVDKIRSAGEEAALAALKRQTRAGGALAACTSAVAEHATTVGGLETADASEVLLDGLGVGLAYTRCSSETASVATVDETGRALTLADDLERLQRQAAVLEQLHVRLSYAQRAARVLGLGLAFVR